jgi:hypothetical protein
MKNLSERESIALQSVPHEYRPGLTEIEEQIIHQIHSTFSRSDYSSHKTVELVEKNGEYVGICVVFGKFGHKYYNLKPGRPGLRTKKISAKDARRKVINFLLQEKKACEGIDDIIDSLILDL